MKIKRLEHKVNPVVDAKELLRQAKLKRKKVYDVTKVLNIKHEVNNFYFDSLITKGFPFHMARWAQRLIDIPDKDFARLIGISMSAFRRLKIKKGRLSRISSDQVYRLSALFAFGVDVLGSEDAAREWFARRPLPLGRRTPLELAETDPGSREVESLLNSIRYGGCL
ncbi:MAG TPA: hypothetical protein DCP92_14560 [Nitrospiraceae bacterium]|nr:hypothetical protein [Nitrospiraceae bacterium]